SSVAPSRDRLGIGMGGSPNLRTRKMGERRNFAEIHQENGATFYPGAIMTIGISSPPRAVSSHSVSAVQGSPTAIPARSRGPFAKGAALAYVKGRFPEAFDLSARLASKTDDNSVGSRYGYVWVDVTGSLPNNRKLTQRVSVYVYDQGANDIT